MLLALPFLTALVAGGVLSGSKKPDLGVNIASPKSNPVKRVLTGGSTNTLPVRLANQAGEQLVISSDTAAYFDLKTGAPLKNMTVQKLAEIGFSNFISYTDLASSPSAQTTNLQLRRIVLPALATPLIKYKFHSENKVGKTKLKVWVSYLDAGNKPHQALGLEEIVSVVEPKKKYFDPELIGLYIIGAAIISFIGYLYLPAKKALPTIPEPELVPAKNLRPIKAPKIVEIGENGGEDEWVSKDILKSMAKGKGGQGNGGLKNRK